MLCVVLLSFSIIIQYSLTGIYGSETYEDNLVFEDNEVFTVFAPEDDDEDDYDDSVEYTLEMPRFEDGLLQDYEETVVEANIQHNENFDRHAKKKEAEKSKRQVPSNEDGFSWRYRTEHHPEIIYDYEQFKDEYDHQIEEIKKKQGKLNESDYSSPPKSQCGAEKFYNKGPFTIWCLWKEYSGKDEYLVQNAFQELVYLGVYYGIALLVICVVGWAHLGYCNIICPCAICFPEDGYEEVKRYLVLNPPGVLVRNIVPKSDKNAQTIIQKEVYRPTETEHYLYNSLWRTVYNV